LYHPKTETESNLRNLEFWIKDRTMIATFLGRVASPTVGLLQDMEFVTRGDRRRDADNDGISAAEMLRKFCEWQSSVNFLDDSSPYHHDTALLLTRYSSEQHTLRA
jgi:hypothetical protein